MNITALTVARAPMSFNYQGLVSRCLHGRDFKRPADVQSAWFDALELVDTERFFFIDDDDELPDNYLEVLARCVDAGTGISYTDESVNGVRRSRRPYSQEAHLKDPTLVHHLVLCDTALARDVVQSLPRGHYWPEMLLYWEMAKRGGATYVPEIGYHWNKRDQGLHREWFTVLGMSNAYRWCLENP
jgi:hypothetical protein